LLLIPIILYVSFGAITAFFIILNINIEMIEKIYYKLVENEDLKIITYDKLLNIFHDKGIKNNSINVSLY
jgi:hypothetical protein